MHPSDIRDILHASQFCGDCGRDFKDCAGEHAYPRLYQARLICLDCKLKEPPRQPHSENS